MFTQILEQLNKLTEEEFDFEDIEIESERDLPSKISGLEIDRTHAKPIWNALFTKTINSTDHCIDKQHRLDVLFQQDNNILLYAYVLGLLNHGVNDGGFKQFVNNNFGFILDDVVLVLVDIGTDASEKVLNIVNRLLLFLEDDGEHGWDDDVEEEGKRQTTLLDTEYHNINDQFCIDIEAYFDKRVEQEGLENR